MILTESVIQNRMQFLTLESQWLNTTARSHPSPLQWMMQRLDTVCISNRHKQTHVALIPLEHSALAQSSASHPSILLRPSTWAVFSYKVLVVINRSLDWWLLLLSWQDPGWQLMIHPVAAITSGVTLGVTASFWLRDPSVWWRGCYFK